MTDLSLLPPEQQAFIRGVIALLEDSYLPLQATRYLSAAAVVLVLFEYVSAFADELDLVWLARVGPERNAFLLHRLIVAAGLLCAVQLTAGLTGDMSDFTCRVLSAVVSGLAAISICLADGLVTREVWQLWDNNWNVMRWMLVAYVAECVGTMAFATATVRMLVETKDGLVYQPLVHSCILNVTPRWLVGTWACGLAFEPALLVCIILNVLHKPRAADDRLVRLLIRDGLVYFIAVIALRSLNLIVASISSAESFFIPTFCSWAFVTILVNRLVINQRREGRRLALGNNKKDGDIEILPLELNSFIPVVKSRSHGWGDV